MKTIAKTLLKYFGIKIIRVKKNEEEVWPIATSFSETIYETEKQFHKYYKKILIKLDMISTDNPLRRNRHYLLFKLLDNKIFLQSNVAECGCWKGLSTTIIANKLKRKNFKNQFYIFDSFEGLSGFKKKDIRTGIKNFNESKVRKHFKSSIELVKKNLLEFKSFIQIFKGWIPSQFSLIKNKKFSFVHIDVDLYKPTLDSLNFFGKRMVNGGLILLDDYGSLHFPGAKLATDNFLDKNKNFFFLPLSYGSAILIKNG
jgi:O-methyltransferase